MSIVLQDQLLQPQECPLVRDLLPDLHTRFPCVLRGQSSTCGTLSGVHDEREDESLLKNRVGQYLLLDGDFDLDSSGVRFSPDERGVDQADFLKWS